MPKRQVKHRVPHPIGGGRYTKSGFWGFIRSGLRMKWSKWPPRFDVLAAARRPSQSLNRRLKWEFQCCKCQQWFAQKEVEVDHIVPCGKLQDFSDLPLFVERLFCEQDGLRVVCKPCHLKLKEEEV